jgi:hypothetical protein
MKKEHELGTAYERTNRRTSDSLTAVIHPNLSILENGSFKGLG